MPHTRTGPRALYAGAVLLVGAALMSCTGDRVAAPDPLLKPGGPSRITSTNLGSISLAVPSTNAYVSNAPPNVTPNGAEPFISTGVTIPAWTCYRVNVAGSITVASNPAAVAAGLADPSGFPTDGAYGPRGTSFGQLRVVLQVRYANNTTAALNFDSDTSSANTTITCTDSRTVTVEAGRAGVDGTYSKNGTTYNIYVLSGSQTVTVQRVTDIIHIKTDKSFIHANENVTFTATSDAGNLAVFQWTWNQNGSVTNPCWSNNPCTIQVNGSGAMSVNTNFLGSGADSVKIYSTFKLSADTTAVNSGDSVTFTTKYDGVPAAPSRWLWHPNNPADPTQACGPGTFPCQLEMLASGTMWAWSQDGKDSDAVAIAVTPVIKLECTPTAPMPMRGDLVNCVASAPAQLAVSQWRFQPDSANLPPDSSAGPSANWGGPLLAPGMVTVSGTVLNQPAQSASVHLDPRVRSGFTFGVDTASGDPTHWCDRIPALGRPIYGNYLGDVNLGWVMSPPDRCTTMDNFDEISPDPDPALGNSGAGGTFVQASSGPNKGYWYVQSMQIKVYLRTDTLQDLRADANAYPVVAADSVGPGCAAANLLPGGSANITTLQVDSLCMRDTTGIAMVSYVRRHESCHVARFTYIATQDNYAIAKFQAVEAMVRTDTATVTSDFSYDIMNIRDSSANYMKRIDTTADNPAVPHFLVWIPQGAVGGWMRRDFAVNGLIKPANLCP